MFYFSYETGQLFDGRIDIGALLIAGLLPGLILAGSAIAIGNGSSFPTFTSLFTKLCSMQEAGEALGQSPGQALIATAALPAAAEARALDLEDHVSLGPRGSRVG